MPKHPITRGSCALNTFQIEVLDDCLKKGSGGLSLPMGSGKTLISLIVALHQTEAMGKKILVVCAKNLLASWRFEINKFFGDTLIYEIFHPESLHSGINNWSPNEKTRVVLTTIDILGKYYKSFLIERNFVYFREDEMGFSITKFYRPPIKPFLSQPKGGGYLFSTFWGCLIVDEAQQYTNINTNKCQSLGAICAKHRWALSGTLFNEPKVERILGYYIILDYPNIPRNLPELTNLIEQSTFGGLIKSLVHRDTYNQFKMPKIIETVISHNLSVEETLLYTSFKSTLHSIRRQVDTMRIHNDILNARRFSTYLLAMITYLRLGLICPLIPLASAIIDISDYQKESDKSELSKILIDKIKDLKLDYWLNTKDSVFSSRIREVIKVIEKHPNDRIVIFSSFRSCINVLRLFLPKERPNYYIKANMSINKRGEIIAKFAKTKGGLLVLTYELGAEGLNLQCSNTILILDFWWNAGRTQQAIARVIRYGQTAPIVNIYFFTSNTGIEQALFEKQRSKITAINELMHGARRTNIASLSMKQILRIIDSEENVNLLTDIYKDKKLYFNNE